MEDKSITYLTRFNTKFLSIINKLSGYCDDLIIVEDELSDVLEYGNREIAWAICYDKLLPYKDEIYSESEKFFEEDIIMNEVFAFVENDDNISKEKVMKHSDDIRKNIQLVKTNWAKEKPENKKKMWTDLKLMIKLCELYNTVRD